MAGKHCAGEGSAPGGGRERSERERREGKLTRPGGDLVSPDEGETLWGPIHQQPRDAGVESLLGLAQAGMPPPVGTSGSAGTSGPAGTSRLAGTGGGNDTGEAAVAPSVPVTGGPVTSRRYRSERSGDRRGDGSSGGSDLLDLGDDRPGTGGFRRARTGAAVLSVVVLLVLGGVLYLNGWVALPGMSQAAARENVSACRVATVTDAAATVTVAHGGLTAADSYGRSGPLGGHAIALDGSSSWLGTGGPAVSAPPAFTELAWFRTSASTVEPILGSSNMRDPALASAADRALWLDRGHVVAGVYSVYDNRSFVVASPDRYNDGKWHLAAVTLSGKGFHLYVDGRPVADRRSVTSAQPYSGWWTIGTANLGDWPQGLPSRGVGFWAGDLAGVAVLPVALKATQIHDLYDVPDLTGYGTKVAKSDPIHYWDLQDASPGVVLASVSGSGPGCPDAASGS